ncbi:pyruvate kinase [Alphaproteobacteria bacterium]|nr:pyruvate kinase [Alphaproteobacteria bacterium]
MTPKQPEFLAAKIVATLGPGTSSPEKILALAEAGVSVFRLNCSHDMSAHGAIVEAIRRAEKKTGRYLAALFDLQGPKLRVGSFADKAKIDLKQGDKFRLDMSPLPGDKSRVCLPHPEIFQVMHRGMILMVNDGKIRLEVKEFGKDWATTQVLVGGTISDHKGVNVPGVALPIDALTAKDKKDLATAIKLDADWIAMSFVQRPEDVKMAKKLIKGRAALLAKIEKPAALGSLDAIVAEVDGIMVARGDLGVECPVEMVPVLQKNIVYAARKAGKPVIIATQMLESMIESPTPTRAEVSDVATAVYDGADAVMLSAESAVGKYPIEAVSTMRRIIGYIENDERYDRMIAATRPEPEHGHTGAISSAARDASEAMDTIKAIVNYTASGRTTYRTARERPLVPILALTPHVRVARQLAVVWGVRTAISPMVKTFDELRKVAVKNAVAIGMAKHKDQMVITAGLPLGVAGWTNLMNIVGVD